MSLSSGSYQMSVPVTMHLKSEACAISLLDCDGILVVCHWSIIKSSTGFKLQHLGGHFMYTV